jgi:signal transduction histidine kinase
MMQIFWLKKMYGNMNDLFSKQVASAMERAAYNELLERNDRNEYNSVFAVFSDSSETSKPSDKLKSANKKFFYKKMGSYLMDADSIDEKIFKRIEDSVPVDMITSISINKKGDNIRTIDLHSVDSRLKEHSLNVEIKLMKMDLKLYDSLFTAYLSESGIDLPHRISILTKGQPGGKISPNDNLNTVRVKESPGFDASGAILSFDMFLGKSAPDLCRIDIKNPNTLFLKTMRWIILSSLLIMILLSGSFIYLLLTLFKQKNIEEIRLDFTHNITHELKTPIAVANAANDVLSDFNETDDPLKRKEFHNVIRNELRNLSDMVERILTLATEEKENYSLTYESINIMDMLESLMEREKIRAYVPVAFSISVFPEDMCIYADRFHLYNALGNVIDNAIKYSYGNAAVEIRARANGKNVRISIEDHGCGMAQREAERIFDKYYRIPTGAVQNVKGFGLGLYYVKIIVEKHGGRVKVYSKEGKGSRFVIILPKYKSQTNGKSQITSC